MMKVRTKIRKFLQNVNVKWKSNYFVDADLHRKVQDIHVDFESTKEQLGFFISEGKNYETRGEVFAVFSFTNLAFRAKFFALIAKAMQLEGYTPFIIQNMGQPTESYFRLFGFNNYVEWDQYRQKCPEGLRAAEEFGTKLPDQFSISNILSCEYLGVPVGRYALATSCRRIKRFPEDVNEPAFKQDLIRNILKSITSFHAADRFFNENPVTKIMLHDIGYARNGPLLDAALRRGIDSLVVSYAQRRGTWVFKRYTTENMGEHEFSLSPQTWEKVRSIPLREEQEEEIEKELNGRYSVTSDLDTRRLQSGKSMLPPAEVRENLNLDPCKKTAVIFAHVSWDGAFFFGEDLFETFDEWLFETVKVAIENPNLNWIVKLHPLNMLHYAMDGKSEFLESEMAFLRHLEPFPPHVRIVHSDTPINTLALFPVIDYGVTVRGTIGVELPCHGIPVLTAGTGRYDHFGFTVDADSKEEYFKNLKDLHTLPRLTEEQRQLARIHYFHLMVRRQVSFEDIAPMELRQLNEADTVSFNNIHIQALSLDAIRNARSIRSFVQWAQQIDSPDFMGPEINAI